MEWIFQAYTHVLHSNRVEKIVDPTFLVRPVRVSVPFDPDVTPPPLPNTKQMHGCIFLLVDTRTRARNDTIIPDRVHKSVCVCIYRVVQ